MLLVGSLVDQGLEDRVADLAVLHLLSWTLHVHHLLELLAGAAVLQRLPSLMDANHPLEVLLHSRFEQPVVLLEVDLAEDLSQLLLGEDPCPLLLEDGVLLCGFVGVDGGDDWLDAIEDVPLDRYPAVGHDLLHLLPPHVEVLVEVLNDLLDDRAE